MPPALRTYVLLQPPLPELTAYSAPCVMLTLTCRGGRALVGAAGTEPRAELAALLEDGPLAELLADLTRPVRVRDFARGYIFEEVRPEGGQT